MLEGGNFSCLSSREVLSGVLALAPKMGLTSDELLSVYILLGDRFFVLLSLLAGKSVKFPVSSVVAKSWTHIPIELPRMVEVGGMMVLSAELRVKDHFRLGGVAYCLVSKPQNLGGHLYALVDFAGDKKMFME